MTNPTVSHKVYACLCLFYPRSTEGGMGVYWIHPDVCPSVCPSVRPSVNKVSGTFWKKLLAQLISYLAFTPMGESLDPYSFSCF